MDKTIVKINRERISGVVLLTESVHLAFTEGRTNEAIMIRCKNGAKKGKQYCKGENIERV